MSKEDYTRLEEMLNYKSEETSIFAEEHFKYGFTLGVLLADEIFYSPLFRKEYGENMVLTKDFLSC